MECLDRDGTANVTSSCCLFAAKPYSEVSLKNAITNHSVVKKSIDQISCDMAGEAVVLNMKSGMYFGMDQVGALVWSLVQEPRTFEYVREAILQQFEVDRESCERDLMAFLYEMESAELINIENGTDK